MTDEKTGLLFHEWMISGDENAFREIYVRFFHPLLGLACRYVNDDAARDIVQDIFLGMWNDPGKYAGVHDLPYYLYRSIRNKCLNYLRNKKTEKKYCGGLSVASEDFFYNALLEEDIFMLLRDAIGNLPEIYRDVLFCSLEGLSDKEVSEKLNISVDNVKTRKKRGKSILRDTLKHPLLLLILNMI